MDENCDGKLQKEEILKFFKVHKLMDLEDTDIENIMTRIDVDKSGFIELQEFLSATVDLKTFLNEKNLMKAFTMFDKDNSGKISSKELKLVLKVGNERCDEKIWNELIYEIDSDGDGEISFQEFKKMMISLLISYD